MISFIALIISDALGKDEKCISPGSHPRRTLVGRISSANASNLEHFYYQINLDKSLCVLSTYTKTKKYFVNQLEFAGRRYGNTGQYDYLIDHTASITGNIDVEAEIPRFNGSIIATLLIN